MTHEERYHSIRQELTEHAAPGVLAKLDSLIAELMVPARPFSSVGELLDKHEEYMGRRHKTPGSISARRRRVQELIDWSDPKPIVDLRREDIERYLFSGKVGKVRLATKRNYLSQIHSFFEWAVVEKYTRVDPTLGIELDKPHKASIRAISAEDLAKAIQKASPRIRAILLLAYEGLTPGEIALLKGSDVDHAKGQLHVPGRKDRIIPLRESVAQDLPNRQGYLFTLKNGNRPRAHNIAHEGNRYLHGIDIRETLTGIRHRSGFDDHLKRRDLQLTQQRMGHASAASTAAYATADAKKVAGVEAEAS